jgi:hypothetical protein
MNQNTTSHTNGLFSLLILILLSSCQFSSTCIEPEVCYIPSAHLIENRPSPFPKLTKDELSYEWGRELYIGLHLANELDLYRAITAFKRALILLPKNKNERKLQLQYSIFECYYLGLKYNSAIEYFESSNLDTITPEFPAFKELMIMVYDCYQQTEQCEKAEKISSFLEDYYCALYQNLKLGEAFSSGDFCVISELGGDTYGEFLAAYNCSKKSPQKAQFLNAVFPGAGYHYVGQKKTAATSFMINALFIGAAYYFFTNNNIPAGLITASLETGWYIGGINGAGLAAKEYNERLYEPYAKEIMIENKLFPVLMLETSF